MMMLHCTLIFRRDSEGEQRRMVTSRGRLNNEEVQHPESGASWRKADHGSASAETKPSTQPTNCRQQIPVSDNELAWRRLPSRAISSLEVPARCKVRLHLAEDSRVSNGAVRSQVPRMEAILGSDAVRNAKAGRRLELTDTVKTLVAIRPFDANTA